MMRDVVNAPGKVMLRGGASGSIVGVGKTSCRVRLAGLVGADHAQRATAGVGWLQSVAARRRPVQRGEGERAAPYNGSSEAMTALAAFFKNNGLFTFVRWGSFMCNPPLCINEEQLAEAFDIIDRGLEITDAAFEG